MMTLNGLQLAPLMEFLCRVFATESNIEDAKLHFLLDKSPALLWDLRKACAIFLIGRCSIAYLGSFWEKK